MEFRAVIRPDGTATVVYVALNSPCVATLKTSDYSHECQAVADAHNAKRDEHQSARAAAQQDLFQ